MSEYEKKLEEAAKSMRQISAGFDSTREAYEWLSTTDNEKLIEEAAKAVHSEHKNVLNLRDSERVARTALVVFEKALTPTDDEREDEHQAQMIAFETAKLEARNSMRHDPHVWHEALEDALDKVLPAVWYAAAGFRRSDVPEPSAEVLSDWFTSSRGVAVAAVKPMTDRGPSVMVDGRVISPNDVAALIESKAQGENRG